MLRATMAGLAALAAVAPAGAAWSRQAVDMQAAYGHATKGAPGGPWKLVMYTDQTFVLVDAGSVQADASAGTAKATVMTIMRPPGTFEGAGTVAVMVDEAEARCSDDGERSLRLTLIDPDGKVLFSGSEGLRTVFTVHDPDSIYNQSMHMVCHPDSIAGNPGYPDQATAIRVLSTIQ